MPRDWFTLHECKINDDDDEKTKSRKEFNFKIAAAKKPYFMTYVYPKLKSENDNYVRNNNKGAIRRFNEYGIKSIEDLKNYEVKTKQMIEYLDFYEKLMPVGNNPCVVNRISWIFEKAFKCFLSRFSSFMTAANKSEFDYTIMKSGVTYSKNNYKQILDFYKQYNNKVENYHKKARIDKIDKYTEYVDRQNFLYFFRNECHKVCPNEDELCDIILDICYQKEKNKQFAWDIVGQTILRNLLKKNKNIICYPKLVESCGDFTYCGKEFEMCEKELEVNSSDYSE